MDWACFTAEANEALTFLGDSEAAAQITARVSAQYGPAALAAPDAAAEDRVWESLRFYLTARPTTRKPFALGEADAQQTIEVVRSLLVAQ